MFTPDNLSLWLQEQAGPLALIVIALVAGWAVVYISLIKRRSVLVRDRSGHNEETFVDHLSAYDFDPAICRATYVYLQTEQRVSFPILPSDALDEDLGLDTEGVRETVNSLLKVTGREDRPGAVATPIATVEDLVRLLQASPRIRRLAA